MKDKAKLTSFAKSEAADLGFDACAIAPAILSDQTAQRLSEALKLGHHASMDWMLETKERRSHPQSLWPQSRSVIMLAMNYGPEHPALDILQQKQCGAISVYARHRDYHDLIKGKLKQIAGRFAAKSGAQVKVFVDTAPVMEKPLAALAGLGWQGKHTNLVSRQLGSWFFLGSIFTDIELDYDTPHEPHCGQCRSCLDICPTGAFPKPYQLDARRCISYLTIEHKGPIDRSLRAKMGNRIYGCDDCLAVCPWNKFAKQSREIKLQPREDLQAPSLAFLLGLDDASFRSFFSGSPIKRIGRNRFIRNCLIGAGNSAMTQLVDCVKPHLDDCDDTIVGAAIWALSRLLSRFEFERLAVKYLPSENSSDLCTEWNLALEEIRTKT